ncbi:MAG: DUF2889 domain-containing protein [Gammaproteobacteria bacterium]|jgi:hypothetical protein|nr:DUF2889 domain-containing protein [Gammaproteobacteria bacterium]MBU2451603.1 DUF2889 domain-containing protein [Gammaproteobacteria bacterium]
MMINTIKDKAFVSRKTIHVREITCVAYQRTDGLIDIEGTLVDTKPEGIFLQERGGIGPDEPVHEMTLRLTVDRGLQIHDVVAETVHSPFSICGAITEHYKLLLIGQQIGPGFIKSAKRNFRGTSGCTHLTELLPSISTTAFQALWGEPANVDGSELRADESSKLPFDGCHALRSDGVIVKMYYPEAYSNEQAESHDPA